MRSVSLRDFSLGLALLAIWGLQSIGKVAPLPADNALTFAQNLLLVQAWSGPGLSWNALSWSISVEWALYLLFPLVCWALFSRLRDVAGNLVLAALALALMAAFSFATGLHFSSLHESGVSLGRPAPEAVVHVTHGERDAGAGRPPGGEVQEGHGVRPPGHRQEGAARRAERGQGVGERGEELVVPHYLDVMTKTPSQDGGGGKAMKFSQRSM